MKTGNALKPSPLIYKAYRKDIIVVCRAMQKSVEREFEKVVAQSKRDGVAMDSTKLAQTHYRLTASERMRFKLSTEQLRLKYDTILSTVGTAAADKFINKQIKYASRSFISSVSKMIESDGGSLALKGSVVNQGNIAFIEKSIEDNVSLIRSVGSNYFDRIEKTIMSSMTGEGREKPLLNSLMDIGGMSERQADLIARDQTSKIHGQLTVENMKRAGITKMKWRHSSAGKKPRSYHQTRWDGISEPPNGLNGYIFDINNPPIIDLKTGERGIPGRLINCRCFAVPVLDV